jgi:hypothetical protein
LTIVAVSSHSLKMTQHISSDANWPKLGSPNSIFPTFSSRFTPLFSEQLHLGGSKIPTLLLGESRCSASGLNIIDKSEKSASGIRNVQSVKFLSVSGLSVADCGRKIATSLLYFWRAHLCLKYPVKKSECSGASKLKFKNSRSIWLAPSWTISWIIRKDFGQVSCHSVVRQ